MRQYATALDGVKAAASNIGAERTRPGSFNALAVLYYRSPEFRNLKASTQKSRRRTIEGFRREHGDKPLKHLGRQHIKAIICAKAATPESANTLLKVLRLMLAVAVDVGMIEQNPAAGIKRFKSRGEGFHTWSEDEIARFEVQHPIGSKARLAFTLLLYTAQRRSDVMRMGWQHVRNDQISVRQAKTDKVLLIPMHPELTRVLGAVPKHNLTFLLTDRGAPFSSTGFGAWFRRQCDEAGLPECSAHGLRKAAATRLANAGCSTEQIKAITGHKSLSEVARYTAAADQERLARKAIDLQIGAEREQALSSRSTRLDKAECN
ncbi:MAG: tyrosine-type recombinase/integrase [Rhizobiales bacterium]|nr:tyrosine-type recombinase/integrase [Hyphomicrobiales bacterium]